MEGVARRRWNLSQSVALGSLVIDCLLVAAKLTAGLLTGSLGLLSDAVHSGLDLIASSGAFVAVRASTKPADREHPYGHARGENLAAFGEGTLLVAASLVIGYEALARLLGASVAVIPAGYAFAVVIVTIAVETTRATVLRRVARATGSAALAGSAQNRFADLISAFAVLVGLIGVRVGLHWADTAVALIVAIVILQAGIRLAWRSGDILIDRAPRGVEDRVRAIVGEVDGVREVREVRVRRSGARLLGDAHVSARRLLSVERAEALVAEIQRAVAAGVPELELTVVVEAQPRDSAMVERVHAVAERLPRMHDLHNVTVEREADGTLHLSMHAKLPGEFSLADATATSQRLETELRREFPGVSRIDVHLEPLEPDLVRGQNVTQPRQDLVDQVRRQVLRHPAILGCRDVELSERGGRITAYVVAEMPSDVTLERAHAVQSELEEQIRVAMPSIGDVVARVVPR
ncbi:MAG: cation diffusion facilitator family transporter [Candidatus Dormiibacterota bacterium]